PSRGTAGNQGVVRRRIESTGREACLSSKETEMLRILGMFTFLATMTTVLPAQEPPPGPQSLTVMSFNSRYGTAKDGENHWENRKENVVEPVRQVQPDLLGTQETLGFQRDFLAKHLPQYEVHS